MADRICTGFIDTDGLDLGCHLVTKECMLEAYPNLVPWMKTPALWLWGSNSNAMIGDNSVTNKSSPVQTISGGANWRSVSPSGFHTAAIKTDGTLWIWGANTLSGLLGTNSIISASSPVQTISGGTNWKSVSAGLYHTAATKTDGTLWLWGRNSDGRLGNNSTITRSSPVQTITGGTNWKSVSAGRNFTVLIKTDGTLWSMGCANRGQLGNNSTINRSSPVQTISGGTNWKLVCSSSDSDTSGSIKTDGTLWLWGAGESGKLGTNSVVNASSPVQTVSGGNNWKSISVGNATTGAIKTDGTLWMWGSSFSGYLGNNTSGFTEKSSPVQTISGGTNWRSVSVSCHTLAIKTDGTLWAWGPGAAGRLGTGTIINRSSPVQTISGGTNWRNACAGDQLSGAIRDEGEY